MKIILIGFMGSGKTSIANVLGGLLNLPILEMDEIVYEKTETKNMYEVFEKGGEGLLRETEMLIAQESILIKDIIISTGGGVVMNKTIFDYFKSPDAKVIFLNASFPVLVNRLNNDHSRPLFKDRVQAQSLYDFRQQLYLRYADITVHVDDKSIQEIAQEIVSSLKILEESLDFFQNSIQLLE